MDPTALVVAAALAATWHSVGPWSASSQRGYRGVVIRARRLARSRPSGLMLVMRGVERVAIMTMHPRSIDPLSVTAAGP